MTEATPPPLPQINNRTSKMSVCALILGVLGTCCLGIITGFPAAILATISLCQRKKHPASRNMIMSIIALSLALCSIVTTGILAALAIPSVNGALDRAKSMAEVSNTKQIGIMLYAYANNHNGHYPESLEEFIESEAKNKNGLELENFYELFYKPGTKELRWKYTSGLSTNSAPQAVLLESVESTNRKFKGKVVYTVGGMAMYRKHPDQH